MLSVHYLGTWPFDNPQYLSGYEERDKTKFMKLITNPHCRYENRFFSAVAHFDLPKSLVSTCCELRRDRGSASLSGANLVIELNTAGRRKPVREFYPAAPILAQAQKLGLNVCLGSDAHRPEEVKILEKLCTFVSLRI